VKDLIPKHTADPLKKWCNIQETRIHFMSYPVHMNTKNFCIHLCKVNRTNMCLLRGKT